VDTLGRDWQNYRQLFLYVIPVVRDKAHKKLVLKSFTLKKNLLVDPFGDSKNLVGLASLLP
jgi:hypothetical protein